MEQLPALGAEDTVVNGAEIPMGGRYRMRSGGLFTVGVVMGKRG